MEEIKTLVNPVALQDCVVTHQDLSAKVLDLSFIRLVVEDSESWATLAASGVFPIEFHAERLSFSAQVVSQSSREGWRRLLFERIVPSARAELASFLSPKRIGESITEDCRTEDFRHFHGLNESELWFDQGGGLLFSYLYPIDPQYQFIVRIKDRRSPLQVGTIARSEYFAIESWEQDIPLAPLLEREVYQRLSEARDIVTNFRPAGQVEYHLKQRLLKVISSSLYSTGRNFVPFRPEPVKAL